MFKKNIFNKKEKPILRYESGVTTYPNSIVSAKKVIPDWYKKIPQFGDNKMFDDDYAENKMGIRSSVKLCVPFLDALTIGYVITLPFDLYIEDNEGVPVVRWPHNAEHTPTYRANIASEKLVPIGHYPIEFTWHPGAAYTVPKGYSILFTHPLNRHDLPFTTLSGVIDGGLVLTHTGNVPFYLKQGFEGLIEKGTPIAQIIPFRQENWNSEKTEGLLEIGKLHNNSAGSVFKGWYKKTFWTKKEYN
jgi:hypothetical protein